MIKELSVAYPVKDSCLSLGVSRSGYYRWLKSSPSQRQREESRLRQEITTIFEQNRKRYGSPRVTRALRAAGEKVGENRVARLMRQHNLVARPKRAFRPKTTVASGSAVPNRIAALEPGGPDQIWVSDITYVATAEGWLYLAVILDLFSRRVVGWKLGENLEAELVVTSLQNALLLRQAASGLIFHSDRGCQYTSQAVGEKLQAIGVLQSMSTQGNCYDNARAEAFFSSLKTECFPLSNCFASKVQARRDIFEYIEIYYNNQRLHSALDYRTPHQYEAAWKAETNTLAQENINKTTQTKSQRSVSLGLTFSLQGANQ
jgi:putative transposase